MASEKTLAIRGGHEAWHWLRTDGSAFYGTSPKGKFDRKYQRDMNGSLRRIPQKVRMSKKARLSLRRAAA